jgi:hypothetical protein
MMGDKLALIVSEIALSSQALALQPGQFQAWTKEVLYD